MYIKLQRLTFKAAKFCSTKPHRSYNCCNVGIERVLAGTVNLAKVARMCYCKANVGNSNGDKQQGKIDTPFHFPSWTEESRHCEYRAQ